MNSGSERSNGKGYGYYLMTIYAHLLINKGDESIGQTIKR
jgi:hypothetical protein